MADVVELRRKAQRLKYPRNWKHISRRIRFDRAAGCCEWCGKPHGADVLVGGDNCWRDASGQWYSGFGKKLPGPAPWPSQFWWQYVIRHGGKPPEFRLATVILQTAHLDHNPKNCADSNLAALCQFCHARYDVDQRVNSGEVSRDLRRGQRVLWK